MIVLYMMVGGMFKRRFEMKKCLLLGLLLATGINCYAEMNMGNVHSLIIVSDKEMPFTDESRQEMMVKKMQIEKNGYYATNLMDDYILYLKRIQKNAPQEIKAFKGTMNKGDTHLKQSVDEIKIAFRFKKLPIDEKNVIAYAPVGSYVKKPEGWNGIKIFFNNPEVGNICAYEFTDLNLSDGGVLMSKEGITYNVNMKPTITSIEGNPSLGFVYSVTWYNNIQVSRIDCVSNLIDKSITEKMLLLANRIDKNGLVIEN